MSEKNPPQLAQLQICNLCEQKYPATEIASRGLFHFCPNCLHDRVEECLSRAQKSGRRSRGRSSMVRTLFSLGLFVGVIWWLTTLPAFDPAVLREMLKPQIAAMNPSSSSANEAGTPADNSSAAVEVAPTPWFKRLIGGQTRRSVEDAGQIHLLYVTQPGTEAQMGITSRLFVTREAPQDDSAKLMTEVGPQMDVSFQEGLRYVRKLPREWERDFSIRLSFEDKFTAKDGGSAGTGFTIAMLAAIQDILLDPSVAVTGDLTVDGSVQPVGCVIEKLRAAIAGQCAITLIPEDNARDAADLALLDGTSPLWETQIFSISTIDEALGMARQDRARETGDAIARFAALRARLPEFVTPNYLQSPVVQTELREVLRTAPNHLSAATLLRAAENKLPPTLSLRRSIEEILATSNFFVGDVINPGPAAPKGSQGPGLTVFPEREFAECMSKLQRLTGILDRRAMELKATCTAYAGALRASLTYQAPDVNALRTHQQWSEVARREVSFQQQIKQDVEDARSRLLLALHKIDADGSLISESTKK